MKNQTWLSKIMHFLNIVLVVVTILAYVLPFLAPKLFPFLSVFSLVLPFLLILNFLFFVYWLLQLKKYMFISGIVLLLGITFINKLYKFSETNIPESENDFVIMSYNVRLFNLYEWLPKKDVPKEINKFVAQENPDILCIQEFSPVDAINFSQYKYNYINVEGKKNKYGQAIYSKFKIINKGEIEFPHSSNKVIYADVLRKKDTIRVYSMHMQSVKISTDINDNIDEEKSKFIFKRISEAFTEQQLQAELIKKNVDACKLPKIICGDMNNSAFSYVYRLIKNDLKDAFEEAGTGFGKSYNFKYYPARIDYLLVEKEFEVKQYQSFDAFFNSDHFPLSTRLELKKKDN
ncbi:endonuclease/exonuclease/phosphatase family protein [uncultured Flavobacterium sp.]|uniref:endonuclease/exonuclease/phosphatase family protein n=1 Tax=uncultured Flavobacterium sp. TaxID=165435 RepID=UPI0030EE6369|tara:strand:- start:153025 stop:154065 length:1041 start_codon:yes stop_codon:yes gene_type:complete